MPEPSPGLKIATLRGVPIYIARSWVLIALVIVAMFGPQVASLHPEWGVGAYVVGIGYALLLLFSVLVHEAAHALVAQACGYRVTHIVADLMGGHTSYDTPDATPGRSALVAAVGPLSNAALAVVGFLGHRASDGDGAVPLLLGAFAWSNAFVAAFNALPGLPLDGGFLVDALVWKLTGNRATGMKAAGWCGRIVAIGVAAWAVLGFLRAPGSLWSLVWLLFIASFLWRGASVAVNVGINREFLGGIRVADVIRPAVAVPASTPVAALPETGDTIVLIDADGAASALVAPGAHVRVPVDQRQHVPASALGEALLPHAGAVISSPQDDVMAILPAFEGDPTPGVVTVSMPVEGQPAAAGGPVALRLVGIATLADLERAMQRHAHESGTMPRGA